MQKTRDPRAKVSHHGEKKELDLKAKQKWSQEFELKNPSWKEQNFHHLRLVEQPGLGQAPAEFGVRSIAMDELIHL